MAKHTSSTLKELQRLSLDKPNRREAQKKPAAALTADLAARWPKRKNLNKLSLSLFNGDLARIAAIQDFMDQDGVRLSTSEAVKLALRTAPLDAAAMRQALDAIRSEDGRKW